MTWSHRHRLSCRAVLVFPANQARAKYGIHLWGVQSVQADSVALRQMGSGSQKVVGEYSTVIRRQTKILNFAFVIQIQAGREVELSHFAYLF